MENADAFEDLLRELILECREELGMTDKTIAYILLKEGISYYLKTISRAG